MRAPIRLRLGPLSLSFIPSIVKRYEVPGIPRIEKLAPPEKLVFISAPGGGLRDITEIVPGIRHFGDLLLVHGRRDVAILCLKERSLIGYGDLGSCFRDRERHVDRNRRSQQ